MGGELARRLVREATAAGLAGAIEPELVRLYCERAVAGGIPLRRGTVLVDTLHPVHEGRVFRWSREEGMAAIRPYGRSADDPEVDALWRTSPFYSLIESGETVFQRNLVTGDFASFPTLVELAREGHTAYLAFCHRFAAEGRFGDMDAVHSSWATDAPGGFTPEQAEAIIHSTPSLALAVKAASLARIAETLVETYLGRDPGRRVLSGRIARGVADRITAVLWFSDLRGFTQIAERCAPEAVIPLLNDYADAVIASIHEAGGDVLKLIGDGTLAVFKEKDLGRACHAALLAERLAAERVAALNLLRGAAGEPVTEAYVGLHLGEVFYGNIGSAERLDFTVVGPAVNEASRIAAMCRSAERPVLISAAFRDAAWPADRDQLFSVGRYGLRGVERPQELFTRER